MQAIFRATRVCASLRQVIGLQEDPGVQTNFACWTDLVGGYRQSFRSSARISHIGCLFQWHARLAEWRDAVDFLGQTIVCRMSFTMAISLSVSSLSD